MKRIGLFCVGVFICTGAFAKTINWYIGDTVYQTTTCESASSITPPTPPVKPGYTFVGWKAYSPIEYLESTGTQYIDTGFIPDTHSRMVIDFYSKRSLKSSVALVQQNSNNYGFGISQEISATQYNMLIKYSNASSGYWMPENLYGSGTGRYVVDINNTLTTITASDGSIYSHSFSQTSNRSIETLVLFATSNNNTIRPGKTTIYSCKLYDNDTLVRDFIPVLDRNGTPCMFDKVEKKFYYNAGTGDFIAGPVIGE